MSPAVTLLCATRNARACVRLTMTSLRCHTPEPYRLLVGDNGSTDGTLADLLGLPWLRVFSLGSDHGGALDWLAARVDTPFFITLDSDVEFKASGWLTDMLQLMDTDGLDALGAFEPAIGSYRARLAPCLAAFRTDRFRRLEASFREYAHFSDRAEAARWRAGSPRCRFTPAELQTYRSARFYPTGAAVFEELTRQGLSWADLPEHICGKFEHLGHMSWAADAQKQEYVTRRLAELV